MSSHRQARWLLVAGLVLATGCDLGHDGGLEDDGEADQVGLQGVRFVTANIDFDLTPAQAQADWRSYSADADVVFLQEARDVVLDEIIDAQRWAVRQDASTDERRGSAVVVRRSIAAADGVGALRLVEAVGAAACGIQTRYVARVDVRLRNGVLLELGSLHMPPKRCWGSVYDAMVERVVRVIEETQGPLVLGGDWNKAVAGDPNGIGSRTGMRPLAPGPSSIDGFYVRRATVITGAHRLAETQSDHVPVAVQLGFD